MMRARVATGEPDQGKAGDHRHRDSLPGQQVQAHRAHRRAGQRQDHRRHQRRARRERPRRHEHRHRAQARRAAGDRAQPALQAHADAGELLHDLPRGAQRAAAGAGTRRGHPLLHRSPHRRGAAPHRLPAAQGPRARAHFRRPARLRSTISTRSSASFAARARASRRARISMPGARARRSSSTLDRERLPHEENGLTLRQIDAILELQLYRLTQLSIDELLNELKQSARARSPSTSRSWPAKTSCARSSSRNWKKSATSTATRAARRSSTRAPSCSLKT